MIKRVILAALACLAVLVAAGALSAGTACAHDPRFACSPRAASNPVVIRDAAKSWAFYGRLANGEEDHYSILAPAAIHVPVSISLDERDASNPGRPVVSVYDASGERSATVDLSASVPFFEPFSRVHYMTSPAREIALPAGRSTIVVSMRGGAQAQRYTFAIGRDERFGVLEIPYVLGAIYRINARKY